VKHELKKDSDWGFTDSNHHTICLQSTAPKLLLHIFSWLTRQIFVRVYLLSVKVYFFQQKHLVYRDSCHSAVFLQSTYNARFQASAVQYLGTALYWVTTQRIVVISTRCVNNTEERSFQVNTKLW